MRPRAGNVFKSQKLNAVSWQQRHEHGRASGPGSVDGIGVPHLNVQ